MRNAQSDPPEGARHQGVSEGVLPTGLTRQHHDAGVNFCDVGVNSLPTKGQRLKL